MEGLALGSEITNFKEENVIIHNHTQSCERCDVISKVKKK